MLGCLRCLSVGRQSIVFSRVEDVLQCLEAAADDPDLEIVRLKNRLDPAFDSGETGGFRYAPDDCI